MALKSRICEILGIEHPIFLAGMGGASVPALAAAVSNAGGLGVLGAAACSPDQLRSWIRETREMTDKPFGVDTLLPASVRRDPAPQSEDSTRNPAALLGEYQEFTCDFIRREHLPETVRRHGHAEACGHAVQAERHDQPAGERELVGHDAPLSSPCRKEGADGLRGAGCRSLPPPA